VLKTFWKGQHCGILQNCSRPHCEHRKVRDTNGLAIALRNPEIELNSCIVLPLKPFVYTWGWRINVLKKPLFGLQKKKEVAYKCTQKPLKINSKFLHEQQDFITTTKMAPNTDISRDQAFDALLVNLESLKGHSELSEVVTAYLEGDYKAVLRCPTSQTLYGKLVETISLSREQQDASLQEAGFQDDVGVVQVLITGLAAFNAFLQANVTGPPTDWGNVFPKSGVGLGLREQCLKSLDVDGVSVYQHIPHVELFSLARFIFTVFFPRIIGGEFRDCKWMRVRINAYTSACYLDYLVGA
jgi:hypothetical protein